MEINLFDENLSAKTLLKDKTIYLSEFKGKAVLIFNAASSWGTTTPGYTFFNKLKEKYGDKLEILAFPSNQHGFQTWFNEQESK